MKKTTFKIRRRVITLFLFCVMSVVIFAGFSFQIHRDIGRRLRLLELTGDLFSNILEARRFEKNFLLYKQPASLNEALAFVQRVEELYHSHEEEILRLKRGPEDPEFSRTLTAYRTVLTRVQALIPPNGQGGPLNFSQFEESMRNLGQKLVEITERWDKEERVQIDRLFQRAFYLFLSSIFLFLGLGILVAFYLARLLVRPMVQMQAAMEKIAHGDFAPIPESSCRSEEFGTLFRAFNRMSQELEEHQEQLLQSRKIAAIGTLTSGIAHELNNPINNIVLTAETLKEDFPQLEQDEAMGLIHDILVQADRASEIVKGLLDFSRSERPEFEPMVITGVIDETLKLVRNQIMLSGINVEKEVPPKVPLVSGDRKSLQQVFLNLFINAIQAMPDGGSLQISVQPADGWLKINVGDTGTGISPQHLPHIFDPFYTTKEVGRGTGLGLSVTYGIIEKHGGHIEAHSQIGEGTVFTITLPIAKEKQ